MFTETADVYDLVYASAGKDYAIEAADIVALVRSVCPAAKTLLDVGCGTGAHLAELCATFAVTGCDLDPGMLSAAQRRLPGVPLVAVDMRHLDLVDRFDAIVCLFSTIGYLSSTDELDTTIQAFARHLSPGGVLIVDGWVRPDMWQAGPPQVLVAQDGDRVVTRVTRSERNGKQTRLDMHYLIRTKDRIEHRTEVHDLTLFSDDDYTAAFVASGLSVQRLDSPLPGRDRYVATRIVDR